MRVATSLVKNVPQTESIQPATPSRISEFDWYRLGQDLDAYGCARLEQLLTPAECKEVASMYAHDAAFRSRVVMARHGFGKGEYKYFRYPLPTLVEYLATGLYPATRCYR